ncbi:MAG: HlyD family secretion protein [Nitrospirae bacterium]|nr:HlyD family secretion protein [Nitrospirota bacterium]
MQEEMQEGSGRSRKTAALVIFGISGIICLVAALFYVRYKNTHISTDDAYIDGRVHTVAAKVPGTVRQVHVADNQLVKKGDLILEIDAADYDVRMDEAESGLETEQAKLVEAEVRIETARKQLSELGYRLEASRANLELQEANLRQADWDIKRAEKLFQQEAISRERYEKTKTGHDVIAAQVKAARDQVRQVEMSLETQKSLIRQAESARASQGSTVRKNQSVLKSAALNMSYTNIYAPSDGYITKKSVEPGNQIQAGQPLMAIVPLEELWITANYKETQLTRVKAGQKVKISVDTYPGKKFSGRVDSIMAGTGSVFSLFPAENATGNFVKVVQRIPVKIVLDRDTDPEHVLRVGMSVEPTIRIQ